MYIIFEPNFHCENWASFPESTLFNFYVEFTDTYTYAITTNIGSQLTPVYQIVNPVRNALNYKLGSISWLFKHYIRNARNDDDIELVK